MKLNSQLNIYPAVLSALLTAVLFGPLIYFLGSYTDEARPHNFPQSSPLQHPGAVEGLAFDLPSTEQDANALDDNQQLPPGQKRFFLSLRLRDRIYIDRADEVSLMMATHHQQPRLFHARLWSDEHDCLFEADADVIQDNLPLRFVSQKPCRIGDFKKYIHLDLEIVSQIDARISIWSNRSAHKSSRLEGWFFEDASKKSYFPVGFIIPESPGPVRRIELLAYMWGQTSHINLVTITLLVIAPLIFFISVWLLWAIPTYRGTATATLALSATLVYVMLIPPFQSPDEANHFLTFARLNDLEKIDKLGLELANRGHFDRIKFRAHERFGPQDLDRPLNYLRWPNHVGATHSPARQPLVDHLWKLWGAWGMEEMGAAEVLLFLRIANALILAGAIALGMQILKLQKMKSAALSLCTLGLVPTLGFFAMHHSNYALITSLLVLQCFILRIWLDGVVPKFWIHLLLGAIVSFCVLSSRTMTALLPFWFLIYGLAILLISDHQRSATWRGLGLFIASTWLLSWLLSTPEYNSVLSRILSKFNLFENNTILSYGIWHLYLMGSLIFLLILWICARLGRWLTEGLAQSDVVQRMDLKLIFTMGFIFCLGAIFLRGTFAGPFELLDIEKGGRNTLSMSSYAYLCLKAFLLDMGWRQPSFYITTSFWGNFGYLDAPLPLWLILTLKSSVYLGLPWGAWTCARRKDLPIGKRAVTLPLAFVALLGVLLILAMGAYQISYNLHGRYLLAFYLFMVSLCGIGWQSVYEGSKLKTHRQAIIALGAAMLISTQAISWMVIAGRYWG